MLACWRAGASSTLKSAAGFSLSHQPKVQRRTDDLSTTVSCVLVIAQSLNPSFVVQLLWSGTLPTAVFRKLPDKLVMQCKYNCGSVGLKCVCAALEPRCVLKSGGERKSEKVHVFLCGWWDHIKQQRTCAATEYPAHVFPNPSNEQKHKFIWEVFL